MAPWLPAEHREQGERSANIRLTSLVPGNHAAQRRGCFCTASHRPAWVTRTTGHTHSWLASRVTNQTAIPTGYDPGARLTTRPAVGPSRHEPHLSAVPSNELPECVLGPAGLQGEEAAQSLVQVVNPRARSALQEEPAGAAVPPALPVSRQVPWPGAHLPATRPAHL